ncbi:MAG: phenylacetate--CoA ligase [Bacillota bacterium]|nr:phenylacetate--CoA ligase [Bacillota bacterium]HOB90827.1 phenylacetate--CoA ligase [Bacillota bacterium]HPZ53992.1 phenylacetate--CoA ligase [Bacillota bacterium]HQD17462.1 phenylacetate--CoA ligase [Bacillota bacterium]
MIWNESMECMPRSQIQELQLERLKSVVERVYNNVGFYRKRLDALGIKPGDIRGLDDLTKLPFTVKDDLRDNYPYGMFAVPLREVVRVHSSSGTTGIPTVVGYTANDLDSWSELVARIVSEAGVTADDVVQISFGYGLFTGAFGLHYGLEKVGATVIPVSSGNTERQVRIMRDMGSTALVSTPSYALHISEVAEQMGISCQDLGLNIGLFGAEPSTKNLRTEIEKRWGLFATNNYGLSEVMGPGVSGECEFRCGMHINEDHFIAEIIDPDTLEPVPFGEKGELVLTTLTKEALPLLRYRTKDITRFIPGQCECGRTFLRMDETSGRTDDMLIIRGVNVFPSQIESVLMEIEEVEPHYQLVITREGYLDNLEVQVEVPQKIFSGEFRALERLERKIRDRILSVVGITVKVRLVEPRSIARSSGKAVRVVDKRA